METIEVPNLMRLIGLCCHVCGWKLTFPCTGIQIELVCSECNRQVHNMCLEGKLFWIRKPLVCKACATERTILTSEMSIQ